MTLMEQMKSVWEHVTPRQAHLGLSGEREEMLARYRRLVSEHVDVKDATVIDFGCGGALLGVHLLSECGTSRYVGFDLAERSVAQARVNLAALEGWELILFKERGWDFAALKPDVIVCLACVLHFPTKAYLDDFLLACDASGARDLVLEVRLAQTTFFKFNVYKSMKEVARACHTNEVYASERLPRYALVGQEDDKSTRVLWYKKVL